MYGVRYYSAVSSISYSSESSFATKSKLIGSVTTPVVGPRDLYSISPMTRAIR